MKYEPFTLEEKRHILYWYAFPFALINISIYILCATSTVLHLAAGNFPLYPLIFLVLRDSLAKAFFGLIYHPAIDNFKDLKNVKR